MDNPTRWNITNSAQNIVSALADPSEQFDHVFRREWGNTFSSFSRHKASTKGKHDSELRVKLSEYLIKLEDRKHIKSFEAQREAKAREQECNAREQQSRIIIPDVFMMEDFDLSNTETFTRVIRSLDHEQVISYQTTGARNRSGPVDESFTKSQLKGLQQSFTDYLDIIEEKLASQISNRSGDFFQVMSSVDSVMDELSLAIKSVTSLRRKCSKLNDALVIPNMELIQLSRTRSNAQMVLDMMKQIAYLFKVQTMIQLSLSASDYVGAIDLIAKSRTLLHKELMRVVSLRHLESQLVEIERVIGMMMEQEFETLIVSDQYSEICERSSMTLLSLLKTQAEKYVNKFHEDRRKKIESNMDIEQWKMVDDVSQDIQRLISLIVDDGLNISDALATETHHLPVSISRNHSRASSDAALAAADQSATKGDPMSKSNPSIGAPNRQPSAVSQNQRSLEKNLSMNGGTGKRSHILAGGGKYVIVNSVIILIRIVMDYCRCAHEIRSLSAELMERLFKILQLYNSKSYHLVYSAGAIQVAGLKTITSRSLVVSQRSLKLVILLIPAIQQHFSQLLPDDNRLRRFDEIKLSYEDHAAKIPERVYSIVEDVIDLQLQEWEAKPPVPSPQFSAVAQHLMRLHDNIQDALPADELRLLFMKISHTFKDVLTIHLRRLNINNDAGPQQWLVTQELTFYKISLSKLSVFKGWELNYDDLWTELNSESDSNDSKHQVSHHQQPQSKQRQQH